MLFRLYFMVSTILKWVLNRIIYKYRNRNNKNPIHILFCMVDHYEPGTGKVNIDVAKNRVRSLLSEYPKLADKHKDSAGNCPKRTWFFPPHYHHNYFLRDVVSLCERGYGEIELHLHHGKHNPDTAENLEKTLIQCVEEYSKFGIFGSYNGIKKYAFIHGDWALDNSRNGKFCGVNNEIKILAKTGCFADFTFPSIPENNPSKINSIYYAKDNPDKPKSYNNGTPVKMFGKSKGDLMLIQGPLYPFFKDGKFFKLRVLGSGIGAIPIGNKQIDAWVRTRVCIKGKEDWIIVKMHTHGAVDNVLGNEMDDIFSYLESTYNDGRTYILHYVSARELYNIIKAAEAGGSSSDPEQYRNFIIQPPKYDSSKDIESASEVLKELIAKTYRG